MRRAGTILGATGAALLLTLLPAVGASAAPVPPAELLPPTAVGSGSVEVALSPDGSRAYVLNILDQTVHVIDTATNTPAAPPVPIATSMAMYLLAPPIIVHPDGRVLILDPGDTISTEPAIIEIDPSTWQVFRHTLVVPAPWNDPLAVSLALTPDGTKAYASDAQNGLVLAVDIPPAAGPDPWSALVIDVSGATTPQILPGSLAIAGGYLYVLDLLGENGGTQTGVAAIRLADDVLEPTVITYTAPAGTTGGILDLPTIAATADGATVMIGAAAELDDASGDDGGFFWTIPGGSVPTTATFLAAGVGEAASFSFSGSGGTAYVTDCLCLTEAWTLDVASGSSTSLDLAAAADLDALTSIAVSPDDVRLFLGGFDGNGDAWLWQLAAVADDVLAVAGPGVAEQGGSATLTVTGLDNSGNPLDLTSLVELESSVATDTFVGNVVTFHDASPHTITATYRPAAGGPAFAAGSITIEVAAILPATGSDNPAPIITTAAMLLVLGTVLSLGALFAASRRPPSGAGPTR